jgi:hypothetical protein
MAVGGGGTGEDRQQAGKSEGMHGRSSGGAAVADGRLHSSLPRKA